MQKEEAGAGGEGNGGGGKGEEGWLIGYTKLPIDTNSRLTASTVVIDGSKNKTKSRSRSKSLRERTLGEINVHDIIGRKE